jgi:hypothetical protein
VVHVWYNGAFLPLDTRVFWTDGPPLHETRTGHKTRSTNQPRTDPRNSPPTRRPRPVASNAPHNALTELATSPFCSSQWRPLRIPGGLLSSGVLGFFSPPPLPPAAAVPRPHPPLTGAPLELCSSGGNRSRASASAFCLAGLPVAPSYVVPQTAKHMIRDRRY